MAENLSLIAIGIAFVSVVIAGLGFILSIKKSKIEKLTHESQFISNIHNELVKIEARFDTLQTQSDCYNYALDYLNAISKLCYFDSRKYLSKDITGFFANYLKSGLAFYNWLIDLEYFSKDDLDNHFVELVKTCKKYNFEASDIRYSIFEKYRLHKN